MPTTRTPTLTELRSFCVAADVGTLGRAAVRLGVSQPALSKRLQTLEGIVGVTLLQRSPQGVRLTAAGRRLYEHARRLLEEADAFGDTIVGLQRETGPVRLAASHSSSEAFVADMLGRIQEERELPVELVIANSQVVRGLVAGGQADVGVAATRPSPTPTPGVRSIRLADDAIVCAVGPEHRWARRPQISVEQFLATPMVVRDPASNARWTVEATLKDRGLQAAPPLLVAATPAAARREALARNAPLLLSRNVLRDSRFVIVEIDGLPFPRHFNLILPAVGEPTGRTRELVTRIHEHVAIWVR